MAVTLAELTVQACAQAVLDWLDRELATLPHHREVIFVEDVPWLDFRNFSATRDDGANHALPGVWVRLANDPVGDDMLLATEPFLVELHTRNPTKLSKYIDPEVAVASRPLPWRRLLIFPTETTVMASTFGSVAPNWYTMTWPFED